MKTSNKKFRPSKSIKKAAKNSRKKIIKKKKVKKQLKPKIEILHIYQNIISNLKNTSQKSESLFREKEKIKIKNFIFKNFSKKKEKKNSTLILYGQPGTGKTLLINELEKKLSYKKNEIKKKIKSLYKSKKNKSLRFVTIFINANNYKTCFDFFNDFFKKLIDLLKINTINFNEPKKKINNNYYFLQKFKNLLTKKIKDNLYLFLMIDELESLFIKDKQNFVMIIDFLNIEYSNFIRFAISNVLDLFASFKDQRVTANFEYCVFKPYNFRELNGIVSERIYGNLKNNVYNLESLFSFKIFEYFIKKIINNNSGDIRELMRRILQVFQDKVDFINVYFPEKYILINEDIYKLGIKDASKIYDKDEIHVNEIFDVLNRLGFKVQLYMLTIYEIIEDDFILIIKEKNIISNYINLCHTFDSNFKTDFNEIKDILVNYGFIKIIKQKKNLKLIQSLFNKKRLKTILSKIKRFEVYFSN